MGENVCKQCGQQQINFQNTKIVHTAQYQEKKGGRRSKQTFLQRQTDGQKAHEKMLNTANY